MAGAEAYRHGKFHLDPFNRLAIMQYTNVIDRQTDRQTDRQHGTDRTGQVRQERQRCDSIGQTVLQTVAQKLDALGYISVAESLGIHCIFNRFSAVRPVSYRCR